jgi:guanosine-3',5'-bis(diphosphate) 3'-pyrophosphohydrolase
MAEFDSLERICQEYLPAADLAIIKRAYDVAYAAHDGQFRKSGTPYIVHPTSVACILAELHQDTPTICAGLLHDTVEDTHLTEKEIEDGFGNDICQLVTGVTKLGKFRFDSKEAEQAENFRKMFLAMAQDVRVVIIKLADRLHNMRTLSHLPPPKQQRIARETREIFAPLAHRMGMWTVKWEMEDLAFEVLQPEDFQRIRELVASNRGEREGYVGDFMGKIRTILDEAGIHSDVTGRPKHFYSIYQKLEQNHISFDELYDILGIRIFVNTLPECYQVLGVVHSQFKPISGRIKDYIAVPKSNLYQSLHTTVIGPEGKPIEIQIRTYEMHQVAEFGVAAHWQYKAQKTSAASQGDFSWLREIVDFHYDPSTPADFLRELKLDLFIDEIFIFSPKGDIEVFPKGSTPVDFAYKIHTEIGHSCIGAKVNGHIVPLDYRLKNGDRVEVLRSKTPTPKLDWLDFVVTAQAKNRIKQFFKRQKSLENIKTGRRKFEKVALMSGMSLKDVSSDDFLTAIKPRYARFSLHSFDELYEHIAKGDLIPRELFRVYRNSHEPLPTTVDPAILHRAKRKDNNDSGVTVLGERNISVKFAKCCNPLPGDGIVGFITLGSGVSIHRADCGHIFHLTPDKKARLVDVEWDTNRGNRQFSVSLLVEGFNRLGFLQDVLAVITSKKLTLEHVETRLHDHGGMVSVILILDIPNVVQLDLLMGAIRGISDVVSVQRT